MPILTVFESKRRCGWRKPGGLYLRLDGKPWGECSRLPIPLEVCPVCGSGYRFSRIPYWIDADRLIAHLPACPGRPNPAGVGCQGCILSGQHTIGQVVLLWIGEQYYPTPADFNAEATMQGVSRRINNIPRGFQVGGTWVFLAHKKALAEQKDGQPLGATSGSKNIRYRPGIFAAFKPARIEYIVKPEDSQEKLDALEKKGITLVKIQKAEQAELTATITPN